MPKNDQKNSQAQEIQDFARIIENFPGHLFHYS